MPLLVVVETSHDGPGLLVRDCSEPAWPHSFFEYGKRSFSMHSMPLAAYVTGTRAFRGSVPDPPAPPS